METFAVTIRRAQFQSTTIFVEAENKEDAEDKALLKANETDVNWEKLGTRMTETYIRKVD